ncbi:MAG: DNA ligase D [Candidatus Melainabacteria bacterium]|nr:DNA ligase D [Candidatus Melainabacteria bacterium]
MIDLSKMPGARRAMVPVKFTPMLASLPEINFSRAGWIYEPKLDGMRAIAHLSKGACTLMSRRALKITDQYPSLATELPKLCNRDVILDGEIIALNEQGRPSFQHLQQRINLMRKADIARAEQSVAVYYFVFDIVYADGYDVTGMKLSDRKLLLNEVLQQSKNVRILTAFEDDGMTAYEVCVENGFEGIVAKRLDAPYEPGRRSPHWIKVKAQQTDEFVVGGFTQGSGSRSPTFGALLLGAHDETGNLIYCGSVGSGFDERLLRDMCRRMEGLNRHKHPFLKRPDEKKQVTWLDPKIVIEIKFMDWTRDGHIRSPVFLRVREDKGPEEVKLDKRAPLAIVQIPKEQYVPTKSKDLAEEKPVIDAQTLVCQSVAAQLAATKDEKMEIVVDGDVIEFTHLNKVMFPATDDLKKFTKRDFVRYIALSAPYSLGYLKDRPLSVVRSPDGMKGKRFYQKHWNFQIPDFVETCFVERSNDEDTEVAMANNFASLLWFIQQGVMEQHVWLSRITALDFGLHPDFMVFDLDLHLPEEKKDQRGYHRESFERVSEVAYWVKEALDSVSLKAFLKTSGRSGLHVFVPIEDTLHHDDVRVLAETISKFILSKHGNKVTVDALAAKQEGKILLDCSPNCKGKTLVAPYSPRLIKEQTVSTPLTWDELGKHLPIHHTMTSVPERLNAIGDIWKDWPNNRKNLEVLLRKNK